jgi:hypothetical protein
MTDRPAIPAELKRRVLIEAGHRCSIPTCRHIEVDVHHIVPWEEKHEHRYEDLIALCPNCHRRADKGEIDRKSLRIYKANLRFTHDKFSQFEVDLLFESFKLLPGRGLLYPAFCELFVKRLVDAGYITLRPSGYNVILSGVQLGPSELTITESGRAFVKSLEVDQSDHATETQR